MSSTLLYTAQLDKSTLDNLQSLENDLGLTLVAVEANQAPSPAQLDAAQIKRIQALEKQSGKLLLAYD